MTTPNKIADRAAEAVMRKIEDTGRIIKSDIADAIEGELLRSQPQQPYSFMGVQIVWDSSEDAAYRSMARVLCGND